MWEDYWFCKQGGEGLDNSFLQHLITEGEADAFAKSIESLFDPSWHHGVRPNERVEVWNKFKGVLHQSLSQEEYSKYMFGNKELGIPGNAGYYYAVRIINSFFKNNGPMTFPELLKIAPTVIYQKAQPFII